MPKPKGKIRSRDKRGARSLAGPANRGLLNLYLNEASMGSTSAARHLLELFRCDLRRVFCVDDPLGVYVYELLGRILALKDARDKRRATTGKGGNEAAYYRDLAQALNLVEPQGRPRREEQAIAKATAVAERMADGCTLDEAVDEVEDNNRSFGAKDAYARHKTAAKANVALKKLGR